MPLRLIDLVLSIMGGIIANTVFDLVKRLLEKHQKDGKQPED